MDVFKEFATDPVKELNGVWRPCGKGRVLVARAGNRKYSRMMSRVAEENQTVLDLDNDASDDLNESLMADVMAATILLGFENLQFDGKDMPYSAANARTMLGVKDFRTFISKLSNDFNAYRLAQEARQEKNFAAP